jgi:hypothetical protein
MLVMLMVLHLILRSLSKRHEEAGRVTIESFLRRWSGACMLEGGGGLCVSVVRYIVAAVHVM